VFTDRRLRLRLRLRYRSSGHGSASERVVDPYGLVCKAGTWYLVADSGGEPRFGANVEVMSPPEVRAELAAVALEIVDLYSNLRLS